MESTHNPQIFLYHIIIFSHILHVINGQEFLDIFSLTNNDLFNKLWLNLHRVGEIIIETTGVNPQNTFGGNWVAWGTGKFPVGVNENDNSFSTCEQQGGEKEHKLALSEMPSHSHEINRCHDGNSGSSGVKLRYAMDNAVFLKNASTLSSGSNKSHNNLPPYITCYFWKRVS